MVLKRNEGEKNSIVVFLLPFSRCESRHDCDGIEKIAIATTPNPKYKQCPVAIETVGAVRAAVQVRLTFPSTLDRVVVASRVPW